MTTSLKDSVRERLRKRGKLRKVTLQDLALHSIPESGWIAVQGLVYDITEHVKRHAGWKCGCAVSELMAILRCLGTKLRF
jgi:Cytochrome b5-like Heme/Steroid binding domain